MIVGVPKEIKTKEFRVALTPAGVTELVSHGHQVIIEKQAGIGAGFADEAYVEAGAHILATPKEVFGRADMILKVKEPQPVEFELIREGQIVFTYFHFSASKSLAQAMLESGAVCIAYETVTDHGGGLPLLRPMSQIAGRLAVQEGVSYLLKQNGGAGILAGGVPGVAPAKVLVIGGGVVGTESARMAAGLGAQVVILDVSPERLATLSDILPANVTPLFSSKKQLETQLKEADLVIGAVLIPGSRAPRLISRDMLSLVKKGALLVDVAVDQGGCFETTRPTTHEHPVFQEEGVRHYCVANMPGAVPVTSTEALTNATLPYVLQLADKGWQAAVKDNAGLKKGLSMAEGRLLDEVLSKEFDIPLGGRQD